jgi:hypothetical protein
MLIRPRSQHLARLILLTFVLTFAVARLAVLLIMTHRIPDMFLYIGGTHVHHLNYGIFLLSLVGACLLFDRREGRGQEVYALMYGIGLALTFDEFGMWLHLGGPYSQRISFDAIAIIASILGLISVAPALKAFTLRHWIAACVVIVTIVPFMWLLKDSMQFADQRLRLRIEKSAKSP